MIGFKFQQKLKTKWHTNIAGVCAIYMLCDVNCCRICQSIIRFPQFGPHNLKQFRTVWCRCCHLTEATFCVNHLFGEGCPRTAVDGERKVRAHAGQMFYTPIKTQLGVSKQSSLAVHPHCHNQLGHCKMPKRQIDPQI